MTRQVSASEQGALQGANGSLLGIAMMIGPGLFAGTFAYFIGPATPWKIPGAAFLLAGVLLVAAAGLAARVTRAVPAAAGAGP